MAALALIDADRVWLKSAIGLPRMSLPRHQTLCALAAGPGQVLVVPDCSTDPDCRDSTLVQGPPHIRFYAAVPLFSLDGHRIGSLSAFDQACRPAGLGEAQRRALGDLAVLAAEELAHGETITRLVAERTRSLNDFRAVLDAAPLPLLVVNTDSTVREWNHAAEQVFGWSAEEAIGQFGPHCGPQDLEEARGFSRRSMAGARLLGVETVRQRRDGSRIPIALSSAPLRDATGAVTGAVMVLEDISQRRGAEAERDQLAGRLRRQAAALQAYQARAAGDGETRGAEGGDGTAAMDQVLATLQAGGMEHTGLWLLSEDGGVLRRVAVRTTIDPAPVRLVPFSQATSDLLADRRVTAIEDLRTTPLPVAPPPGAAPHRIGAICIAPIRLGGTLRGVLAAFDPAPRRWTPDEQAFLASLADLAALALESARLVEALDRLAAEKRRAEGANRAKSLFLANMGHELRTPLNAVIGFADLLQDASLTVAERIEFADHIRRAGLHLLGVFNDILDQARAENGTLQLDRRQVALPELLLDAVNLVSVDAAARQVKIETRLAEALPPILADAVKLRQAVVNLLANAVKFSHAGQQVTLTAQHRPGEGFAIAIRDHGPGMAPEAVPRALEPFAQLDEGHARRTEGAGLGLPLARVYAELHGGSLAIDTAPGEGTTATIRVPG
jgi:PAS domain S-box-containing protein